MVNLANAKWLAHLYIEMDDGSRLVLTLLYKLQRAFGRALLRSGPIVGGFFARLYAPHGVWFSTIRMIQKPPIIAT
jgi:hypothetical protein